MEGELKKGVRYHLGLVVLALGSATLFSGCQITGQQATVSAKAVIAGNAAGAAVAGIVNPGVAIPATAVAGIGDALACGLSAIVGGTC